MIQRMVDDELDEIQRAEFLKYAEANPRVWRETALAFVEDRVWSSAMIEQTSGTNERFQGAGTHKLSPVRRKSYWSQYGSQLLITAATVLLVFSLALRFNPVDHSSNPSSSDGMIVQPAQPPADRDNLGPEGSQLAVQPLRLHVNENFDVPIYEDVVRFRQETGTLFTG